MATDLATVEDRNFSISNFCLQNGNVMPTAKIVYETYGRLAPDGRNAALITHGYTSSHHAAGRNPANGNLPGWWDGLIGPGKAIDTGKLFVVSSNMLGSSFGSTNGASINPGTGQPYGPDFPAITVRDIIAAQKALLDELGVRHLVAVAGPSYGGYQAFQWAVAYPDLMDAIVPVVTAPKAENAEHSLAEL
jgi:homoserine O-acetyltransferase/O-succinyltransferase